MRRAIAICVMAVMLSACAQKADSENLADGGCSTSQSELVEKHISGQIDALAKKDWELAFSFASESFQENIGIDQFTQIISTQYTMLIENQGYNFSECAIDVDKVMQEVKVSSNGTDYYLTYRVSINGSKLGIEGAVVGMADTPVTV
jgi:hypothetical protein